MNVILDQYRKPQKFAVAYARYSSDNGSFGGLITTLAPIKKKVSFQRKKNIWAANE